MIFACAQEANLRAMFAHAASVAPCVVHLRRLVAIKGARSCAGCQSCALASLVLARVCGRAIGGAAAREGPDAERGAARYGSGDGIEEARSAWVNCALNEN